MAIAQPVPADARMVATSLSIWVSISASLVMLSHNRARMPSLGLASLRIAIAYLADGIIPGRRVGRRWVISRTRITAWLDENTEGGGR